MSHLFRCALFAAAATAAATATTCSLDEFCETYALAPHGRIAVDNGNVRITTWDRDEVRVEAYKRGVRPDDAQIVVDSTASALSIRTQYTAPGPDEPATVEYRITVPRTANLEDIRLVNGGLSIVGVAGDVKASAVNGDISAEGLTGQADLSTVNGKLDAGFFRICDARSISLKSINGPITLSLPSDAKASVDARNYSGGIRSSFGRPLRPAGTGGHSLRTNIKGGGTRIRLHNVNGGILITAPGRRPNEC
jgi:DUF4097 and DUF4098 domain-containing protein YvlB